MPLQWRNQIWQSLEEGAGKLCSECGVGVVIGEDLHITLSVGWRRQTTALVCDRCVHEHPVKSAPYLFSVSVIVFLRSFIIAFMFVCIVDMRGKCTITEKFCVCV